MIGWYNMDTTCWVYNGCLTILIYQRRERLSKEGSVKFILSPTGSDGWRVATSKNPRVLLGVERVCDRGLSSHEEETWVSGRAAETGEAGVRRSGSMAFQGAPDPDPAGGPSDGDQSAEAEAKMPSEES